MIRRSFVLGAAAMSFTLAGCGGGSPSPSPTPTPTTTPTPTPTPISYGSFPLTGPTEFGTIDAFLSYTGDPAVGAVTLGAAGTEAGGSTRFRVAVLADPTTASTATGGTPVVIHENAEEVRFDKAQLIVPPATTVDEYIFDGAGGAAAGQVTRGEFLNNTTTAKVTATAALALTRESYTGWIRADSTAGNHRVTYGVWGFPTVASDLPTTGTATYTTRIAGRTVGVVAGAPGTTTVQRLGGTVTVTVNFATGMVTFTANVTTVATGGVETPYGTFSGSGAIAAGATQFVGSLGAGSPVSGTIAGSFFGPAGAEIGVTFAGEGTVAGANSRMVGVLVGKKN
jgi:hypothetical protein